MSETIGIGILGCGSVGSAVADILTRQGNALAARTGLPLELRHVLVRDLARQRAVDLAPGVLTDDSERLFTDGKTRIIVELIGGVDLPEAFIRRALSARKDVVTANKALLALRGEALFGVARQAGRCIAFEAAVAGGIPLIQAIGRGLIANEIDAVYGILNGTCNYILTRMLEDRINYRDVLADAQRLGFAEADPTLDVDGTDSAHKLAILASLAMRRSCRFEKILVRGISDLEVTDLLAGEELGYVCKLLAIAQHHDDGLDLSVQPTFIRKSHPLAGVRGPFNAVSVYGHAVGHTLYYGRGAGGMPTASAIVSDLVDVASGNAGRTFAQFSVLPDQTPPANHRPAGENESPFYLRVGVKDRPGGMGMIATLLGQRDISIASLVQHESHGASPGGGVPIVVTTRPTKDRTIQSAIAAINGLDAVTDPAVCIPVLDEHVDSHDKDA